MESRRSKLELLAALAISIALVITLDVLTNPLDLSFFWDHPFYIDMAENGITGNPHLFEPFAYRIATPLLARLLSDTLSVSTHAAFRALSYLGAVSQLVLVFFLARRINPSFRAALIAMLVVALSLFSVKWLLFDVYTPDALAFPLMALAVMALFSGSILLVILISAAGLLVREFLIIPAAIAALLLLPDLLGSTPQSPSPRRTRLIGLLVIAEGVLFAGVAALINVIRPGRMDAPLVQALMVLLGLAVIALGVAIMQGRLRFDPASALQGLGKPRGEAVLLLMLLVILVGGAAVLPRALIDVSEGGGTPPSVESAVPAPSGGDSDSSPAAPDASDFPGWTQAPFDIRRTVNLLFVTASYLLPSLLLITRTRLHAVWELLAPYRLILLLYTLLTLLIASFGGADLFRFITYLFLPQAILIAALLRSGVHPAELAYMLIAVAIFNRIVLPIPVSNSYAFLNVYGGFDIMVNDVTLWRTVEILAFLLGALSLRWLLNRRQRAALSEPVRT